MTASIVGPSSSTARARRSIGQARTQRFLFVVTVLLIVGAWFGSLEMRGLFIPDEGRYAEIPREMLAGGDWITPRLNGLKYFEKPPLQYWLTALSFLVFGEDEWTARLPVAMLGFFSLLMIGYTGYRLWDARTGIAAAAVLGSSWMFFLGGQYLTLDMSLTACMSFVLCSFLLAQSETTSSGRRTWMLAAWAGCALAVLSKGLIGLVLPTASVLAYVALQRETVLLKRLHPVAGGAFFLLIASPWFIAVQLRNPEFLHFFFVHEHFQRFAESGHHRPGAWWYYLPIMLVGLMPWTPALVREGVRWLRERRRPSAGFSPHWFCAVWAGVIVLFFSASQSKLPAYILPASPALAVILASGIRRRGVDSVKWCASGAALAGGALLGLVHALPGLEKFASLGEDAIDQLPWLYLAAGSLSLSGLVAFGAVRRKRVVAAVIALAIGSLGFWNLAFGFLHVIDDNFSSERLIEALTNEQKPYRPEVPFYLIGQFDQSVPFYLGRTVTLVNTRSELGPGIDAEPGKVIATTAQFEVLWRAQKEQAYAILAPDLLAVLRQGGLPVVELVRGKRLVVVGRRSDDRQATDP